MSVVMATSREDQCDLANFCCDVVGAKLYDAQRISLPFFHQLYLQREPTTPLDSNAALVTTMYGGREITVGHMAK